MTLGQRVQEARRKKGLTQKQAAGDRITRNMLSQIEHDLANPSMKTLEYLARTLEVSVGWLLTGQTAGTDLAAARSRFRAGDWEQALRLAMQTEGESDERSLLIARACLMLAKERLYAGEFSRARELAQTALEHDDKTVYGAGEIRMKALWLIARCDLGRGESVDDSMERFRQAYDDLGWEAKNHLVRARYQLEQGNLQAAERELWMVTTLPEEDRPGYLILRGSLAIQQEKYGNALSFLRQAEELPVRTREQSQDLYTLLETASREMEDYKAAYEYAAKLREL